MKKFSIFITFVTNSIFLIAQDKVTKMALHGKWQITSISVENLYYYDIAKDSLVSLRPSKSITTADAVNDIIRQDELKKNLTKGFVQNGNTYFMIFNSKDTAITGFNLKEAIIYTYTFDEASSTLVMNFKPETNMSNLSPVLMQFKVAIPKKDTLSLEINQSGVKMITEYKKLSE